jgi:hypothetical protein
MSDIYKTVTTSHTSGLRAQKEEAPSRLALKIKTLTSATGY